MSLSDDLYRSGELDTDQPLVRIKRGRGDSRYNSASNPNRGRKRIRWGKHQLCHSKQIKLMQNRSPETASQPGHFSRWHIPRCSTSDTILSIHKDLPAAARASESCHPKPRQIENPDTEKQKYRAKFKEFLQWPGSYMSLELMKTTTIYFSGAPTRISNSGHEITIEISVAGNFKEFTKQFQPRARHRKTKPSNR